MLWKLMTWYRRNRMLDGMIEANHQEAQALQAAIRSANQKEASAEELRKAAIDFKKELEANAELLKRRMFDCDIREALIEAKEASMKDV